jgi:hypothetical protein
LRRKQPTPAYAAFITINHGSNMSDESDVPPGLRLMSTAPHGVPIVLFMWDGWPACKWRIWIGTRDSAAEHVRFWMPA